MRNHEDDVFCIICEWKGTHHELVDDKYGEIDEETEDLVQYCPECASSWIIMLME